MKSLLFLIITTTTLISINNRNFTKFIYYTETSEIVLICENDEKELNKISIVYKFCKDIIKYTVQKLNKSSNYKSNKKLIKFRYFCKDFLFAFFKILENYKYEYEPRFLIYEEDAEYFSTFFSLMESSIHFIKDLYIENSIDKIFFLLKHKNIELLSLFKKRMFWTFSTNIPLLRYIEKNNSLSCGFSNCSKFTSFPNDCSLKENQILILDNKALEKNNLENHKIIIIIFLITFISGFIVCIYAIWKVLKISFRRSFKKNNLDFNNFGKAPTKKCSTENTKF